MLSTINPTQLSLERCKQLSEEYGDGEVVYYHTTNEFGQITVVSSGQYLLGLGFGHLQPQELVKNAGRAKLDPSAMDVTKLMVCGTDFQFKVWQQLTQVTAPTTYKQLATILGMPKSCRAVANAVGANPISILIPCHRIVGSNDIGGYRWGVDKKRQLLAAEGF